MNYVVAVDTGGTFTDCVVVGSDGRTVRAKAPSTPPSYEQGVVRAVEEAATRLGLTRDDLFRETTAFVHGTTVATNLLLTRTGARVALLTTRGHEDAILIGRTVQKVAGLAESEIADVANLSKAEPLVDRPLIFGVDERVDRTGRAVVRMRDERVLSLLPRLREAGVEAVAVSFLWSFLNPEHERRAASLLSRADGWFVTTSSALAPVLGEYERTATTVLNAYLTPGVAGYLERMRDWLRRSGHRGAVAVMHSAGGVLSVDEARHRGVSLLSSGPAGGVLGARALARQLGLGSVIATDVGGTSFDVGLVVEGEPLYAEAPVFAKYPVALPVMDVRSIGAGGGSIAWVEPDSGVLRVGPRSAGARPGPACYGAGGREPTVTDANVVLGRIDPHRFLGGRMPLDPSLAREAVGTVAASLGVPVLDAAEAIVEVVNAHMADLIRKVTVERGIDPRNLALVGYGGAAGLHAADYARRLGIREVVIPRMAAVFSAFGMALADLKRVAVLSEPMAAPFDLGVWRRRFDDLEAALVRAFQEEGLASGQLVLRRFAALRFRGQVHSVRVPVHDSDLRDEHGGEVLVHRFVQLYEATYGPGTAHPRAGVEVVTFSVEATAPLISFPPQPVPEAGTDPSVARRGERRVRLRGGVDRPVAVYDLDLLLPGHEVEGPALLDADDTTVLLDAGDRLRVDGFLNLRLEPGGLP
jgi:N-methylhydantoinase A